MPRLALFKHLRTKLTVLYVALFVATMVLVSLAVYGVTSNDAERALRDRLAASGLVFENLSNERHKRLQDEAGVLAHDFGFRAAVATHDAATVRSALDNLAARSGVDLAFVVDPDGHVMAHDERLAASMPRGVVEAVQAGDADAGDFVLDGVAYEAVAAPINAPGPVGWVVFATAISPRTMTDLARLSAIPLQAEVLSQSKGQAWVSSGERNARLVSRDIQSLVGRSLTSPKLGSVKLPGSNGGSIALIQRLPSFGYGQHVVLLLRCPLAEAVRPYSTLVGFVILIGLLGVALLVAGSWVLAETVTRPLSSLEQAARRLRQGESARVVVETADEIAQLGLSFNAMADRIEERETSLIQARNVAEEASSAKSVFLANMNHEIRTPLNGVLGTAGVLSATTLTADQRKMVDLINASGAALQNILNDILVMVDLGADQLDLLDRPFSLDALVEATTAGIYPQAAAKGLDFRLLMEVGADPWLRGDEARITQILNNLLSNALKFTARGEVCLNVSLDRDLGVVRFCVSDTGVGFDPTQIENLFTMFRQSDGSMTRKAGGMGLGLSLARDLARAMGGDIHVGGGVGQGAAFTLTLPLVFAQAPPAHASISAHSIVSMPADPEQPDDGFSPIRVLLADDHPANRTVIELILGAMDVEIVSVENGAEAVEAFKVQPFDVVLMDLQMPVMDGLTAIKLIRAHEAQTRARRTPVVVISANVQIAHFKASAEAGADNHLAKPIVAATLIAVLDDALNMPEHSDAIERSAAFHSGTATFK